MCTSSKDTYVKPVFKLAFVLNKMNKHPYNLAYIRGPFSIKKTIKSKDEWVVMLQKCTVVS